MASDVFDNEDARYVAEARRWPYVVMTTSSPKYAFDDWVEAAAHCLDRTGHSMLICKTCSPARRDVRPR
jgi:hypothetical protein